MKYLQTHEWHLLEGDIVTIGLSQFAVDELTDITFVDITAPTGSFIKADEVFGEVEYLLIDLNGLKIVLS